MFRCRSHLRIPAILACALLLLAGAGEAAGLKACPRHGDAEVESTAEKTADESHQLHHTRDSQATHAHGESAQTADADDMAHSGHSHGSTGCDCVFACLGAAQIQPLDPSPPTVMAGNPPAPATDGAFTADAATFLPYLIPHFLPFPNAPPATR